MLDKDSWHSEGASGFWLIFNPVKRLAFLDTCQESRHECRKLAAAWEVMTLNCDESSRTLVNWEIDTILINTNLLMDDDAKYHIYDGPEKFPLAKSTQKKIKHLAISMTLWKDW